MTDKFDEIAKTAPTGVVPPVPWYRRRGPAVVAFCVGLAALAVALVTTPDDTVPRLAQTPDPGIIDLAAGAGAPSATTVPAAEADGPTVLGAAEENPDADPPGSDDGSRPTPGETLRLVDGAADITATQLQAGVIGNGVVQASWALDGAAVAATESEAMFVTAQLDLAGDAAFAPGAAAVLEMRCVGGDCPDGWETWTALPAGVVETRTSTTFVPRPLLARFAEFELRARTDPSVYVIS